MHANTLGECRKCTEAFLLAMRALAMMMICRKQAKTNNECTATRSQEKEWKLLTAKNKFTSARAQAHTINRNVNLRISRIKNRKVLLPSTQRPTLYLFLFGALLLSHLVRSTQLCAIKFTFTLLPLLRRLFETASFTCPRTTQDHLKL